MLVFFFLELVVLVFIFSTPKINTNTGKLVSGIDSCWQKLPELGGAEYAKLRQTEKEGKMYGAAAPMVQHLILELIICSD